MKATTFLNPDAEPRKAYDALRAGLHRMAAHDPLADEGKAGAMPELTPEPRAVVRDSGFLAFQSHLDYDRLPGQAWTITCGDVLVVEPEASYGPGDVLLLACLHDELTLAGVRADGSLCWMTRTEDDLEPDDYMLLGVVVEVRKGRNKPTVPATPEETDATPSRLRDLDLKRVLVELGSRDGDDFLPELLPAPWHVSQATGGAGADLAMPGCFAMSLTRGFDHPNRRGWTLQRGDVLIFSVQEGSGTPEDVWLVLQGADLTLADADSCSLRDGEELGDVVRLARAVQHRPFGQIGGVR